MKQTDGSRTGGDGLFGQFDSDYEDGGPGNDVITGGGGDQGADYLVGGDGTDVLSGAGRQVPKRYQFRRPSKYTTRPSGRRRSGRP